MDVGSVVQVGGAVRHNPLPPLSPFVEQDGLDDANDSSGLTRCLATPVNGGFIGCGQLAWRAIGPTLEIFDITSSTRQAAWTFGAILHSSSAKVICVCGIGVGTITHVAVGIDLGSERRPHGMVGILSLQRSRITRAFHFQHKVTNICMITGGEKLVDPSTLASELRHCQGLLAVATAHAFLFLVDIALDMGADEVTSDEVSPATYASICVPDPNSEVTRNRAIAKKAHPLLCLSESMNSGGQFRLLGPDDNILFETASHSVSITYMAYVPQLASLVIGYNFGSFQIINLSLITVDCTSPYEENMAPVFSVAYQEPEHDPRSFVYLWICRSFGFTETTEEKPLAFGDTSKSASCTLYAMNYEKKEWIEGHGLWYQILLSISPRFDFDLKCLLSQGVTGYPSKMLSAVTVIGATPSSSVASPLNSAGTAAVLTSADEESGPVPELSLCMFCWEANFLDKGRILSKYYIAIFDINQWYQAQMPQRLIFESESLSPYMSFHRLDKVPKSLGENLLSSIPRLGSWSRHTSKSTCENDWFPSSLSYDLLLLTSQSLVTYRCPSVQQRAIMTLVNQGPKAIVYPHPSHAACVFAGMLPQDSIITGSSVVQERENLLNVALEYDLLPLLMQCTLEFSEGLFSHLGCSLEVILLWAWNKVHYFKSSYDTLCAPLFKASLEALSAESLIVLHQNLGYLAHISTIIAAIRDSSTDVTTYSKRSLDGRVQVVKNFQMHLQAILWFYHCGLLPQCITDDEPPDENAVPFPATALQNSYDKRYSEIKKLSSSLKATDVLLIDALIEESADELSEIWEKDRMTVGVYPPPSLQCLLTMYMLPGLSLITKHRIVQYFFLDLASILSDSYSSVVEELVKFPSSFSLSPSVIKITQAFWLIDHGFFQEGLDVLMHPLVNPDDVTSSQHRRIIKAFLFQGEEKLAITYNQIRQPPHEELEDVRLNLTVLLANGRIREAYHYQQMHRVRLNAKDLLNHFFVGCEQIGSLEALVHLPLSIMEEEAFIAYLQASSHPVAQDILLSFYVQQSRYSEIDVFQANAAGQRQSARSAIVHGYLTHLPSIQNKKVPSPKPVRTIYRKPKPFSACIRQSTCSSTPHTKLTSQRLNAIQAASGQKEGRSSMVPFTPFRSRVQRRKAIVSWNEEMGFVNDASILDKEIDKDVTCIVFPTMLEDEQEEPQSPATPQLFPTIHRREQQETNAKLHNKNSESNYLKQSISHLMEEVLRNSFNATTPTPGPSKGFSRISSDVVSLLKTPPVHRPPSSTQKEMEAYSETPQSILKVRKILQRSISPADLDESLAPHSSFPSQRSLRKALSTKKQEEILQSDLLTITPKQLRFHLPSGQPSSDTEHHPNNLGGELGDTSKGNDEVLPLCNQTLQQLSPKALLSSESPSPRKPLPGFVEREHKPSLTSPKELDENIEDPLRRTEKAEDSSFQISSSSLPSKRKPIHFFRDEEPLTDDVTPADSASQSTPNATHTDEEKEFAHSDHTASTNALRNSLNSSQASLDDSFHSLEEDGSQKQSFASIVDDDVMDVDGQVEEAPNDPSLPSDVDELPELASSIPISTEVPEVNSSDFKVEDFLIKYDTGSTQAGKEDCENVLDSNFDTVSINNALDSCLTNSEINTMSVPILTELNEEKFDSLETTIRENIDLDTIDEPLQIPEFNVQYPLENQVQANVAAEDVSDAKSGAEFETEQSHFNEDANVSSVEVVQEKPESLTLSLTNSEISLKRNQTYDHIYNELDSTLEVHLQSNSMADHLKNNAILVKDQEYLPSESISESAYVLKFSDSEDESDNVTAFAQPDSPADESKVDSIMPDQEIAEEFKDHIAPEIPSEVVEKESTTQDCLKSHEELESNLVLRFSDSEDDADELQSKDSVHSPKISQLEGETLCVNDEIPSNANTKALMPDMVMDEKDDCLQDALSESRLHSNNDFVKLSSENDCSSNENLVNTKELLNIEKNSSPVQRIESEEPNIPTSVIEPSYTETCSITAEEKTSMAQTDVILNNNSESTKLDRDSLESCENECQEQKKRRNSELPSLEGTVIGACISSVPVAVPKICIDEASSEPNSTAAHSDVVATAVVSGLLRTHRATPKKEAPLTPVRRSRRLSGLSHDGEEANDEPSGRVTPLRRSRRLSGISNSEDEGALDVTSLQTPSKRNRRLSGSSPAMPKSATTPKRRGRKPSGSANVENNLVLDRQSHSEDASKSPPSKDVADATAKLQPTPVKDPSLDAIAPTTPTHCASPGRSRRQKSLLSTPEIVVRRSARLSCTPDILGTIMEEKNAAADNFLPQSQKTPKENKLVRTTPVRSRRRSLNQSVVLDPNLETIEENAELPPPDAALHTECLLKTTNEPLSNHDGGKDEEALLNGSHPHHVEALPPAGRQTRRRSYSSNDSPAFTANPTLNCQPKSPSRRRRASLSSVTPKDSLMDKGLEASESEAEVKDNHSEDPNYKLLSPAPPNSVSLSRRSTILVANSTVGASKIQVTNRKSIRSLSQPIDYDISIEETKYSRRKSRLKCETPSTILGVQRHKSRAQDLDGLSMNTELVFEDDGDQTIASRLSPPKDVPSPALEYKLISITPESPVVMSRQKSKKRKAVLRRTTRKLSAPKDYEGFSDEEEVAQPRQKARKTSSSQGADSVAPSEGANFLFSKPDVIEDVPIEVVNSVVAGIASSDPSFVFSPPHNEKLKTKANVKKKSTRKKR